MQFEPFNFMSIYQSNSQKINPICLQLDTQETLSQMDMQDYKTTEQTSTTVQATTAATKKSNASEYHNMTKQLVITMKQVMAQYIKHIGSSLNKRTIIRNVWEKVTKKRHPTKSIFKLIFDPAVNPKLLQKEQIIESVNEFNGQQFKAAMQQLKDELIIRMKENNIRSNLIDREIAKKDILLAYIQHFINEELRGGEIKARFGPSGSLKIKKIVNQARQEVDFISDFLI